jgi:hypothetical protein
VNRRGEHRQSHKTKNMVKGTLHFAAC